MKRGETRGKDDLWELYCQRKFHGLLMAGDMLINISSETIYDHKWYLLSYWLRTVLHNLRQLVTAACHQRSTPLSDAITKEGHCVNLANQSKFGIQKSWSTIHRVGSNISKNGSGAKLKPEQNIQPRTGELPPFLQSVSHLWHSNPPKSGQVKCSGSRLPCHYQMRFHWVICVVFPVGALRSTSYWLDTVLVIWYV